MGTVELVKGLSITKESALYPVYKAALDWAMAHFKPMTTIQTTTKPKPEPTKSTTEATDLSAMVFANAGEFYAACVKHFNLQKSVVEKEIQGFDLTDEKGRQEAWVAIVSIYGSKSNEEDQTTSLTRTFK